MHVMGWTIAPSFPNRVYADSHVLPDGRVTIVTACVSGYEHGYPLGEILANRLPRSLLETSSLAETWNSLDRIFSPELPSGNYVECSVASYDPERQELDRACFGAPEPILVHGSGASFGSPAPRFMAFGLIDDVDATAQFESVPIRVQTGDVLVCHEGLADLRNAERVEFSEERLREVATRAAREGPDAALIADAVRRECDEHRAHERHDDQVHAPRSRGVARRLRTRRGVTGARPAKKKGRPRRDAPYGLLPT